MVAVKTTVGFWTFFPEFPDPTFRYGLQPNGKFRRKSGISTLEIRLSPFGVYAQLNVNDIADDRVVDMVDVSWHLWVTASPTYVEHLEGPLLVAPSKLHAAAAAKRHVPRSHYADRDARRKLLDTDAGNVCRLDGASKGSEQGCFAGPWRHIADCAFALTKRHAKSLGFFPLQCQRGLAEIGPAH